MNSIMAVFKCMPFLFLAGVGTYMLCVALFPSCREPDWRQWKLYTGYDTEPHLLLRAMGFMKPRKPDAVGEMSEKTARSVYLVCGCVLLLIAFVGIRHFAGIPEVLPDLLDWLPG